MTNEGAGNGGQDEPDVMRTEDFEPVIGRPVTASTPVFDPAALYSALQQDLAAEAASPSDAEPSRPAAPPLTRRELRERREAAEAAGLPLPEPEAPETPAPGSAPVVPPVESAAGPVAPVAASVVPAVAPVADAAAPVAAPASSASPSAQDEDEPEASGAARPVARAGEPAAERPVRFPPADPATPVFPPAAPAWTPAPVSWDPAPELRTGLTAEQPRLPDQPVVDSDGAPAPSAEGAAAPALPAERPPVEPATAPGAPSPEAPATASQPLTEPAPAAQEDPFAVLGLAAAGSAPWDPAPELRTGLTTEQPSPPEAPAATGPAAVADPAPTQPFTPEQVQSYGLAAAPGDASAAAAAPATVPVSYDGPVVASGAQPPAVPPTEGAFPMRLDPPEPPKRRPSLRWLGWFIPLVVVLGLIAYPVGYVAAHKDVAGWRLFGVDIPRSVENKARDILGIPIPVDYDGSGNGTPVVVTINEGDSGADIARELNEAGVTMTFEAFYDLAIARSHATDCASPDPTNGCWPTIQFGNYDLQQQMSAEAALAALTDPANKVTNNLVIPEGKTISQVLNIVTATTGIPLADLQKAAADPAQFGADNPAHSLEGYLFPDTYQLDGKETATSILQRLVDETFQQLGALGVAPADRHAFLTGASMVQKESGATPGDMAKVARVFQNRLDQDMLLQSDATVSYGAGNTTSIWNTSAQLGDASNLYNTYVHKGLPLGPIAAPGKAAMEAWAKPAAGDWLFFVPVNLKTGETHFSTTAEEHQHYVDVLREWCQASAENAAYCK